MSDYTNNLAKKYYEEYLDFLNCEDWSDELPTLEKIAHAYYYNDLLKNREFNKEKVEKDIKFLNLDKTFADYAKVIQAKKFVDLENSFLDDDIDLSKPLSELIKLTENDILNINLFLDNNNKIKNNMYQKLKENDLIGYYLLFDCNTITYLPFE